MPVDNGCVPLHHFIPAAYLGGFSESLEGPRRSRPVWCLRRGAEAPFRTVPGRVGAVHDLYTLHEAWQPDTLDEIWTHYERNLPRAIEELSSEPPALSAATWLRVLVPFATALFVRGHEFGDRYGTRSAALAAAMDLGPDHVSMGRIIEFQRLLAPVTAAEWTVLDARESGSRFITSDLALAPVHHARGAATPGYAVPLSPLYAVVLTPVRERRVMTYRQDAWTPFISRRTVSSEDVASINASLAFFSREFLIGQSSGDLLVAGGHRADPQETTWLTAGWTGTREEKIAHEFDWHRLAGLATVPLAGRIDLEHIDYAGDWIPPVAFPANLPWFRSGLHLYGRDVFLELRPRRFPR